jgi:hypothetical protein
MHRNIFFSRCLYTLSDVTLRKGVLASVRIVDGHLLLVTTISTPFNTDVDGNSDQR